MLDAKVNAKVLCNVVMAICQIAVLVASFITTQMQLLLFYQIVSVIVGIFVIAYTQRHCGTVVLPQSIFALVWMILIPVSSGSAPAMRALNSSEIAAIVLGGAVFTVSSALSEIAINHFIPFSQLDNDRSATQRNVEKAGFGRVVLAIACLSIIVNLVLNYLGISGDLISTGKAVNAFKGYSFISSAGAVGALILVYAGSRIKVDYALIAAYAILELLTGQRWYVIVLFIVLFSSLSFVKLSRRHWILFVGGLLLAVAAFYIISGQKSGIENFQKYYIDTGLYNGSAKELAETEIIRYLGMSQRTMGEVLKGNYSIHQPLSYTLTPISFIFESPEHLKLGVSINAYTASNALSYIIADGGSLWWAILCLIAIAVNMVQRLVEMYPRILALRVAWATCILGLTLSFFAYINAYFYWILAFPALSALGEFGMERLKRSAASNGANCAKG